MPPDVQFSEADILSSGEAEAGWYPMHLVQVSEGPGKTDPSSTTWTCQFEVTDGPRKGMLLDHWFSSKMMKGVLNYIKCFVAKIEPNKTYPLGSTTKKAVMGWVKHDLDRNTNVITAFKPVGK